MQTALAQQKTARARRLIGASGGCMLVGAVLGFVSGQLHPHHEMLNDHVRVFAEYAASTNWLWVHYVQFAALLIVVAGLLLLYESVRPHHLVSALEHGAIIAATGTVAVFALNMAVDAVALKRAVDAWAAAPESEKMVRFASAEAIRWLEWGANSFFQILLGLSLTLFGLSIARTAICWRVLGWIGVLAGLGLILGGLLTGRDGFAGSPVQTAAQLLFMTMALGMVVSALFRVTPRDPTPSLSPTATHQAAAR